MACSLCVVIVVIYVSLPSANTLPSNVYNQDIRLSYSSAQILEMKPYLVIKPSFEENLQHYTRIIHWFIPTSQATNL
jgi:hypothetical protein